MARRALQIDMTVALALLGEGCTVSEIAHEMDVPYVTLNQRFTKLRREWGCRNNTALVAQAYHRGILLPRRVRAA